MTTGVSDQEIGGIWILASEIQGYGYRPPPPLDHDQGDPASDSTLNQKLRTKGVVDILRSINTIYEYNIFYLIGQF
jgi:hypothetical protein